MLHGVLTKASGGNLISTTA